MVGYVAERGSHTVQFAGEPAQSELLLRNEKYQLKTAPLPSPAYTWTGAVDEALVRVCRLQLGLQDRVAEWHKLGVPAELHGAVAIPPPPPSDAPAAADHPEFKILIGRIHKLWPSKWMTAAKVQRQYKNASAQQAAAKAASAKAASPPKAASPQPPPAQPQAQPQAPKAASPRPPPAQPQAAPMPQPEPARSDSPLREDIDDDAM